MADARPTLSLWQVLAADAHRYSGRLSIGTVWRMLLTNRCFRPVFTLRLCQHASRGGMGRPFLAVFQLLHRMVTHSATMDLSWHAEIGPGLLIVHGWGLVVSPGARIGRNVTLFHGVTLGRGGRTEPDGRRVAAFPIIEDEVWIGPHAIVVGGVRVGRGSRLAGGAFVTRDVAPASLMGGNPAVLLRADCEPDVAQKAPV